MGLPRIVVAARCSAVFVPCSFSQRSFSNRHRTPLAIRVTRLSTLGLHLLNWTFSLRGLLREAHSVLGEPEINHALRDLGVTSGRVVRFAGVEARRLMLGVSGSRT